MNSTFTKLIKGLTAAALIAVLPLRAADPVPPTEPVPPAAPEAPVAPAPPTAPTAPKPPRGKVRHTQGEPDVRIHQDFTLKAGETSRGIVVVDGNATVDGRVEGDLVVVFGKATLGTNAVVTGDFVNVLGGAELAEGAVVNGELMAVLSDTKVGPEAQVGGKTSVVLGELDSDPKAVFARRPFVFPWKNITESVQSGIAYLKDGPLMLRPIAPRLGWVWMVAGGFFVFRLLVTLIARKPVAATANALAERPLMSILAGVLTILFIGPVAALLSFTIIGPLALMFAYWIAGIIGTAGVYCLVGQQLGRLTGIGALQNLLLAAVVGTVVIYGAYCVPILGFLVVGIVWLLSIGGAVMAATMAMQDRRTIRQARLAETMAAAAATAAASAPVRAPVVSEMSSPQFVPVMQMAGAPMGVGAAAGSPSFPGAPDPANASFLMLPRAGFWIRMAAAFLDMVLMGVAGGFVTAATHFPPLVPVVWLAYFVGMIAWKGTTSGGIICGLKVVRTDGARMTPTVALVRALSAVFSALVFFLGFFWIGWSVEKQGWHDVIAGTCVVKSPRSQALL